MVSKSGVTIEHQDTQVSSICNWFLGNVIRSNVINKGKFTLVSEIDNCKEQNICEKKRIMKKEFPQQSQVYMNQCVFREAENRISSFVSC